MNTYAIFFFCVFKTHQEPIINIDHTHTTCVKSIQLVSTHFVIINFNGRINKTSKDSSYKYSVKMFIVHCRVLYKTNTHKHADNTYHCILITSLKTIHRKFTAIPSKIECPHEIKFHTCA